MSHQSPESRDLSIIDQVLRAIRHGDNPLLRNVEDEFRKIRQRIVANSPSGDLENYLTTHPEILSEVKVVVIENALKLVEEEIRQFETIKSRRPLTSAEKKYGRECLVPLLDGLARFMRKTEKQDREETTGRDVNRASPVTKV